MKISSKIEICNLALARIEQNSISSFENDSSVQGQFCRMVYEQSKSALLAQYNWTFAIYPAKLNQVDTELDEFKEYSYKYTLPEGFLRLVSVYNNNEEELINITNRRKPFVLEGKYLFSDINNCKIKYIKDIDTVTDFSPLFIDCFVLDLAVRLTRIFNSSTTLQQQLLVEFSQAIEKAKISDCQQTTISQISSYPLLFSTWGF